MYFPYTSKYVHLTDFIMSSPKYSHRGFFSGVVDWSTNLGNSSRMGAVFIFSLFLPLWDVRYNHRKRMFPSTRESSLFITIPRLFHTRYSQTQIICTCMSASSTDPRRDRVTSLRIHTLHTTWSEYRLLENDRSVKLPRNSFGRQSG